jgi:hypothetical protein
LAAALSPLWPAAWPGAFPLGLRAEQMKLGADHHVATCACLACGQPLDGALGIETDDRPAPGNTSLCIYCGHLMAFADDMTLRELTNEEAHEIAGDEHILMAQRVRARMDEEE